MKAFNYAPKPYAGSDMEGIASAVNIGYILLPIFLTAFLIQMLVVQSYELVILICICLIFTFIIRRFFLAGQLNTSIIASAVLFNIALTVVCTIGNGINDIAILGYPIIIGFSALILDQKKLAFSAILSMACISWLVVGERLNLYTPNPIPAADTGDFVLSALLIFMGGYVAFSLTNNMKHSIKDSQAEISASKKDAAVLKEKSNEKLEIIGEIHRAVINSLSHIQELMLHKQKDATKLTPLYEGLKRKVLVIEVAHSILLSKQAPLLLNIKELTNEILLAHKSSISGQNIILDSNGTFPNVRLDFAINYGICLIELLHNASKDRSKQLNVGLAMDEDLLQLEVSQFDNSSQNDHGIVMDLLTKQLKGHLHKTPTMFILKFKPTFRA